MKRRLRIGLVLLAMMLLISGGVLLIQQKKKELGQVSAYGGRPRPVSVVVAEKGDLSIENEYLAVVEPFEEARISPRVTSEVKQVLVDEGDRVEAGSVLAELDTEEIEHRIEAAEANIEQARTDLSANKATVQALRVSRDYWQAEKRRGAQLVEQNAIAQSEAERTAERAADVEGKLAAARQKSRAIEKQIEALEQQKKELFTRRGYYTLSSPFSGLVSERGADPGDLATPGQPLLVVQDQSRLKISFDVPQKDLTEVKQGLTVSFSVGGQFRETRISVLHPAFDEAKMIRAEAWPDTTTSAGLTPGAYLPVNVRVNKLQDIILVPESALIKGPRGKGHVFAVTDGSLTAKPVEVLVRVADRAAVKGIDAETQVVENTYLGWAVLSSGEKVEPMQ